MEAVILVGGLGTRLRPVISDMPKPMALINGIPFLQYILQYLYKQRVQKVVMATGYKSEVIESYFGDEFKDVSIAYSVEKEPLGTGGAIKQALEIIEEKDVLILNGDTFFNVDLSRLMEVHSGSQADLTIALKPMQNFSRYGSVKVDGGKVTGFKEKAFCKEGLINGGTYMASKKILDLAATPAKFSFETDFMEKYVNSIKVNAYISDTYFIDIGIPEDYKRAQLELGGMLEE